ncbi:MAG: CRTAC1 family protein [Acidobacteriota bacterium]
MPPASDAGGFTDVTLAAGITAQPRLTHDDLRNIVEAVGSGAAFADLDGDGWLDLVVLGGTPSPDGDGETPPDTVHLYRNGKDGRFEELTADSGVPPDTRAVAVAVADIDGDGDRDIYFVDRGPNHLFRNRGNGTFDDVTAEAHVGDQGFGIGAVFLDLERDGDLDLYVANYLRFDPGETAYFAPDGYPGPLAYRPERDVLYVNRGDGTFEEASGRSGIDALAGRSMSLAAADFDDDGDTDIFVANDSTENFLWINDGSGRFTEDGHTAGVALGENGEQTSAMAASVGDVDGDGQLDLAVSDTAFGALYRRLYPGVFADDVMSSGLGRLAGQYVSWGQSFLDMDNDGDLDLFLANGGLHHLVGWEDLLLRNEGSGRFEDASDLAGDYFGTRQVSRGSITGDYDNDGDIDLFVTTLSGRHFLLRNDAPSSPGWITLDLAGARGRDAFGAKVEVRISNRTIVAEARCPTAYLGQSDPRLHFGLGAGVDRVDHIAIVWPDGKRRVLDDVPAGRILRIEESVR